MTGGNHPGRAALAVHGGAGGSDEGREERQRAVERALAAGWAAIDAGAVAAAVAAVMHLESEPVLNAGVGACLNADGEVELDAAVMDGRGLRAGAVGAVRDVLHPVELALRVMDDGRHVLLVAEGASRFARDQGIEAVDPAELVTEHQRRRLAGSGEGSRRPRRDEEEERVGDTVGAVCRDRAGGLAVAVSTGGRVGKLPGRVGDSPLVGAGFYAREGAGAVCGTGHGEAFIRLCTAHATVDLLEEGVDADEAARRAVNGVVGLGGAGGVIVVGAAGEVAAAHSTQIMPWAFHQEASAAGILR